MKRLAILLAFTAAALAAACQDTPTAPLDGSQTVIEAFLYAGEPVKDVRLTATVELGSADTVPAGLNDANVVLIKGGTRYKLTLAPSNDGHYQYTGSDLSVNEGDVFDLEVTRGGVVATARTVVPTRPGSLSLSADSLLIPSFGRGGGGRPDLSAFNTRLIARWPNPGGDLFYVTIESTDPAATEIEQGPFAGGGGAFRRFIFAPSAADSFAVAPQTLAYYGMHQVRVYHVNTEYAALYESRMQDSRDLNEPATNIHNALGVFSAFSSRTAAFRAVAQN